MMTTETMAMLDVYPGGLLLGKQLLTRSIETCLECTQAGTACSDADLGEQMVADLAKCARLNLDCADMCETTARVLTRQTGYDRDMTRAVVQACAQACRMTGDSSAAARLTPPARRSWPVLAQRGPSTAMAAG